MTRRTISIHYRRVPDRVDVFEQEVLEETPDYVITYLRAAQVKKPVLAEGGVILEPGAPVVWFTYPGRWYDVGRFHLADGTFTGCYANVLTPVVMDGNRWETTDLCLDVWVGADGTLAVLDEEELDAAVAAGWIDAATAERAREVAAGLVAAAGRGEWPGAEVRGCMS